MREKGRSHIIRRREDDQCDVKYSPMNRSQRASGTENAKLMHTKNNMLNFIWASSLRVHDVYGQNFTARVSLAYALSLSPHTPTFVSLTLQRPPIDAINTNH